MRRLLYALVLLAVATPLFASDVLVGTWKINPDKSKYTEGQPTKDLKVVVVEEGSNLQVTATGTNTDGSPLLVKYSFPVKGGTGVVQQAWYDGVTSKVISKNVRENKFSKGGKVVRTRTSTVSADGKTCAITMKGLDATGKPSNGVDALEKQ